MSLLWRKIKRSNKKAAKFRYSISCKELLIECAHKWRPESIVVALMHRKRRYSLDPRRLEWSFENPNQAMVLWPESVREPLSLTTTLFRDQEHDQYEDKEWTLIIEEITAKGKHKPLAAVSINLRLFITDLPGALMEVKFKLRPLRKEVIYCTVQFDISSKLLRESEFIDSDRHSIASAISIPEERPSVAAQGGLDSRQIESLPIETEKFAKDVRKISVEIENLNHKSRLEPITADANQSVSSVSAMPQFSYDVTKISSDIHNFASPSVRQDSTETNFLSSKNPTTPRTTFPGDESPKLSRKRYKSGQKSDEPQLIDMSSADQVKSLVEDIKALHSTKPPSKIDDYEASQRTEKLRQEARKMLQNAEIVVAESKVDDEARKRLQDEYRKLKAHTNSPAPQVSNELPPTQPLRRTASARSNSGSNTDLRNLEVITTQTNFRQFKKFEPSPQLQRKNYDIPILPAYGRSSNGTSERLNGMKSANSTPIISAFNRAKNYGSMRGQELVDSISQIVSPGLVFVEPKQQITVKQANSQQSTPTRKLPSQLEKDLRSSTDPSLELQKINEEIDEIERKGAEIMQKMQTVENGSIDEQDLLTEHIDLTNKKDALVRRQDYFNMLADLNETKEKLALVREEIQSNGEFDKTHADKQKTDRLMADLKELSEREVELTQELDRKIEEEENEKERGRQTLERTRNFNRAQQEPLSASKRFISMFRP